MGWLGPAGQLVGDRTCENQQNTMPRLFLLIFSFLHECAWYVSYPVSVNYRSLESPAIKSCSSAGRIFCINTVLQTECLERLRQPGVVSQLMQVWHSKAGRLSSNSVACSRSVALGSPAEADPSGASQLLAGSIGWPVTLERPDSDQPAPTSRGCKLKVRVGVRLGFSLKITQWSRGAQHRWRLSRYGNLSYNQQEPGSNSRLLDSYMHLQLFFLETVAIGLSLVLCPAEPQ